MHGYPFGAKRRRPSTSAMWASSSAVVARSRATRATRLRSRSWSQRCDSEYLLIAKLLWPGAGSRGPRFAGRTHCRMRVFGARRATQSADLGALRDLSRDGSIAAAGAAPEGAAARPGERMRGGGSRPPEHCQGRIRTVALGSAPTLDSAGRRQPPCVLPDSPPRRVALRLAEETFEKPARGLREAVLERA